MIGQGIRPMRPFYQYPPSASPQRPAIVLLNRERYVAELLAERQKLGPFLPVLPLSDRILNQEIRRLSGFSPNAEQPERLEQGSRYRLPSQEPSGRPADVERGVMMPTEENRRLQGIPPLQGSPPVVGWFRPPVVSPIQPGVGSPVVRGPRPPVASPLHRKAPGTPAIPIVGTQGASHVQREAPGAPASPIVKRVHRLDVPVEKYPNYNFIGRLLGPRGNSLKRIEASTRCRVFIRGRGSIKDAEKEERLKNKRGYEHLKEPLHVLIIAELPENIINSHLEHAVAIIESILKPVDGPRDRYKKQQMRELAMLRGTLRGKGQSMSRSM